MLTFESSPVQGTSGIVEKLVVRSSVPSPPFRVQEKRETNSPGGVQKLSAPIFSDNGVLGSVIVVTL